MNSPDRFPITANKIWAQQLRPIESAANVLFLDRDGVVVEDTHHLSDPKDVVLIDGAGALIRAANAAGIAVVFVTNQSGIGQGLFGWPDFAAVQQEILLRLAADQAHVDLVFASPFHPTGTAPYQHPCHPFRKPMPGMLLAAAQHLGIGISRAWIVGDRAGDLWAGRNAGLAGGIHVGTGYGGEQRADAMAVRNRDFRVETVYSVQEAPTVLQKNLFLPD